jgi:hypothetical protein
MESGLTDNDREDPVTDNHRTRRQLEQVVETLVYAPIGLFFEAPSLLPKLVAQGKTQVRNARVVGKLAVEYGHGMVRQRLGALEQQVTGLLRVFEPAVGGERDAGSTTATEAPAEPVTRRAPGGPSPDVDELAIPGYDSLSASQVVSRLAGLGGEELEAVRAYEAAHRGRKTVLNKIAQLQA